jgi:AhpD family alkylhydroperoxidase
MNFIRQTQKFHCPDTPAAHFSIDAGRKTCALFTPNPASCDDSSHAEMRKPGAVLRISCFNDELHSALSSRGRFLLTSWKTRTQAFWETLMSTFGLIECKDASPEVRAVYDDIMATRKTDWINNFWKAIAHDPALLKRTWESLKQIMAPGALDPLTKELVYIAVSVTNNCNYCIASHTASAFGKGMTDAMFKELQAIIGMANETNKLVTGYQVEVDQRFQPPLAR